MTRILADNGGNIYESQQFNDGESRRFFMRVVFTLADGVAVEPLRTAFAGFADGGTKSCYDICFLHGKISLEIQNPKTIQTFA